MVCCICLEEPTSDNPLFLLSCGCKVALFHESCENAWMSNLQVNVPIVCLICKREPVLKNNYSFSYEAGPAQKLLWDTAGLALLEIPLGIYYKTPLLSLQALYILSYPLIFPFRRNLVFFLMHYRIRVLIDCVIFFSYKELTALDIIIYRLLHILFLCFFIKKPRINPLTPFIISREITHHKIAWQA